MSLFNELKRRNVIRVAVAYLVIAWLIVQVIGVLSPMFDVSASFQRGVVLLLAVGFLPAMFFSWAFEITPEGIKKEKDVVRDESITNMTAKKLDYITVAAAVGVLGLFAYQQMNPPVVIQTVQQSNSLTSEASSVTSVSDVVDASIAVLPFADLSPNNDQSHFSDGIAEEILNVLVRIDDLKVASRTSAFGFKGQESLGIPLIAERLKVRHVLEGSVRKSGDKVRITAQLIDAKTDVHLWSDTFDRELTTENIFAVQDEIAGAIVKQLGLIIGEEVAQPSAKVATESVDAYEFYLKAQGLFHVRSGNNIPEIVELYEKAVAIDPKFSEGWAGLGKIYSTVPFWNLGSFEEYYAKAEVAADRASELNPKLALPYAVRADIEQNKGNLIKSIEQLEIAAQLDPANLHVAYIYGALLLDLGYFDLSENKILNCLEIDSSYEICRRFLSFSLLYQGNADKATELFEHGMVKGQGSYREVFENYYSAIGDTRALSLLLVATVTNDKLRELFYRFETDDSFSLDALNAEIQSTGIAQDRAGRPTQLITMDTLAGQPHFDFYWSPYLPVLRRPELRDEYMRVRKRLMLENGLVAYWRKHGFPPQCRAVGDDDFECDVPEVKK